MENKSGEIYLHITKYVKTRHYFSFYSRIPKLEHSIYPGSSF